MTGKGGGRPIKWARTSSISGTNLGNPSPAGDNTSPPLARIASSRYFMLSTEDGGVPAASKTFLKGVEGTARFADEARGDG